MCRFLHGHKFWTFLGKNTKECDLLHLTVQAHLVLWETTCLSVWLSHGCPHQWRGRCLLLCVLAGIWEASVQIVAFWWVWHGSVLFSGSCFSRIRKLKARVVRECITGHRLASDRGGISARFCLNCNHVAETCNHPWPLYPTPCSGETVLLKFKGRGPPCFSFA